MRGAKEADKHILALPLLASILPSRHRMFEHHYKHSLHQIVACTITIYQCRMCLLDEILTAVGPFILSMPSEIQDPTQVNV